MPQANELLEELLQAYCAYWKQCQSVCAAQSRKHTHFRNDWSLDNRKARGLGKLVAYCRSEGLDPHRWLYALFVYNHFRVPVAFDRMANPKALTVYEDDRRMVNYDRWVQGRRQAERDREFDQAYNPERDINHGVEMLKRVYLLADDLELCMSQPDRTRGYHPGSEWCAKCRLARACLQHYQSLKSFDVLALRRSAAG